MVNVADEITWERVTGLFDQLLLVGEAALATEADPEIRTAAEQLWRNHLEASVQDFLGQQHAVSSSPNSSTKTTRWPASPPISS